MLRAMSMTVYDLAGADADRRFSPYCWRTKLALAHKGLDFDAVATRFLDIPEILGGGHKSVPVLVDEDRVISDSWRIADYLEEQYPDRPPLNAGPAGRAQTMFIDNWVGAAIYGGLFQLILKDIYDVLDDANQAYFRQSREARIGMSLEDWHAQRDGKLDGFRRGLQPLRQTVSGQPFICGEQPMYADYIAVAGFAWAHGVSDYEILADDDPVDAWRRRCFDLFDGLAWSARPATDKKDN